MSRLIDLAGKKFGLLMAVRREGSDQFKHALWLCDCECGNRKVVLGTHLIQGNSQSCGCYSGTRTHGMSSSPERHAYAHAKSRCENADTAQFGDYGGRGIEFRFKSFEEFFAVVGLRPRGKTLDRIDNNGHYEAGNLRWATRKEQQASRRISVNALMRTIAWG